MGFVLRRDEPGGKPVKTTEVSSQHVQHILLTDVTGTEITGSNPLPVSTSGAGSLVTFTHSRPSIPNNASTAAIAANSSRKAGSYIMNNTGQTLWGNYGATAAVLSQGFKISNQQVFIFNTTQAINVIQNSGAAVDLDVFEAT